MRSKNPLKMDQEVNLTGLLYKWAIIMFNMKQTHRESKQCVLALYFLRLCDLTTNALSKAVDFERVKPIPLIAVKSVKITHTYHIV